VARLTGTPGKPWPNASGHQRDSDDVHADLALPANAGMQIVPVSADQGLLAGRLRARHYHREKCAVSLNGRLLHMVLEQLALQGGCKPVSVSLRGPTALTNQQVVYRRGAKCPDDVPGVID
jgi:hypothetical protein